MPNDLPGDRFLQDTMLAHIDSAYMQTDTFLGFFEFFLKHLPAARPILLILDGHKSHGSWKLLQLAQENGVILLALPPHLTHKLQLLDVAVFRNLKESFKRLGMARMRKNKTKKLMRVDFGKFFGESWDESITGKTVHSGFRASGIWPLDRSVVKLTTPLAASTPQTHVSQSEVESHSSASTSSVSASNLSSLESSSSSLNKAVNISSPLLAANKVANVLEKMLQPSPPKKENVKITKRIKFAVCMTTQEYMDKVQEARDEQEKKLRKKEERDAERKQKQIEKEKKAEELAKKRRKKAIREMSESEDSTSSSDEEEKPAKKSTMVTRRKLTFSKNEMVKKKVDSSVGSNGSKQNSKRLPGCPSGMLASKFRVLTNYLKTKWNEPILNVGKMKKKDWFLVRFPIEKRQKKQSKNFIVLHRAYFGLPKRKNVGLIFTSRKDQKFRRFCVQLSVRERQSMV